MSRLSHGTGITALSRTDFQNSSILRNPGLWVESGPGPRHPGSRPDGSRPEAAACLSQDGPGEQRERPH